MTDPDIRALFQHIGMPKAVRMGKDTDGSFVGYALVIAWSSDVIS